MKNFSFTMMLAFTFLFVGCSNDEEWGSSSSKKHVLPFKVHIVDEDSILTRACFNGYKGSGVVGATDTYRLIYWQQDDEIKIHAKDFKGTTKAFTYKIQVESYDSNNNAKDVVLWGDTDLPWWTNDTKDLRCIYPASKYQPVTDTNDLSVVIDKEQNAGYVSKDVTGNKAYYPAGQSGNYTVYNYCDYSNLIIYAGPTGVMGIKTGSDSKPSTDFTLNFFLCVKAIDVFLDAPTTGSMTPNSVKVEIGTGTGTSFKNTKTVGGEPVFDDTYALTGTISPSTTGQSLASGQQVTNKQPYVKLNFTQKHALAGNDRIDARILIPRQVGNTSSKIGNCTAKVTVNLTNSDGITKEYVKYVSIGTPPGINNAITNLYLGPVPTF